MANAENSAQPGRGYEGDLHRLIDALTDLADATVGPVVRTLQVVTDGVAPREGQPHVELHRIEQRGTELVSSAVRLAERLAALTMDVLRLDKQPASGASPARSAVLAQGVPGSILRVPMSVENPGRTPMVDLVFKLAALKGPPGGTLGPTCVRVDPERLTIAPADFEKLSLVVDVPQGAAPGIYEGLLQLESKPELQVPFRFAVTEAVRGSTPSTDDAQPSVNGN
jgi:hypothetical protein